MSQVVRINSSLSRFLIFYYRKAAIVRRACIVQISFNNSTLEIIFYAEVLTLQSEYLRASVYINKIRMGNFVINLWWGGDPDKPDPFSGMTLRDIYQVQRTWAPVYDQAGTYGMEMFLRLFRKDPNTKTFFKVIVGLDEEKITASYQFQAHVKNLMALINTAVVTLKEPQVVAALMNKLGETHHGRRIEKFHFDIFKEIWIDVLQNDLKVNEQVMASWIKFINFIYKYIYEKLNDS